MRFFHISDLHIGKQLGGFDLTEDMRYVLFEQILGSAYEKYKPDALIIAGDVYDKASPSAQSVALFDELITRAAELSLDVYIISGNHDSAERVSYGRRIFSEKGVYISEPFSSQTPLTVFSRGKIDIALLPYISAEAAISAFPDEDISDITSALSAVFRRAGLPRKGRPCLLVAHQAAAGAGAPQIGSLEAADYRVFEPFAYTALGHFHTPHNVGGSKVRYCGSPLCFSAKEAHSPQKYLDIIDINDNGEVITDSFPLVPLYGVQILEDSFDALMSDKYTDCEAYAFITVLGDNALSGAARQLTSKFPRCVGIKYEQKRTLRKEEREYSEMEFGELFGEFYKLTMGTEPEKHLLDMAREIFDEAQKEARR